MLKGREGRGVEIPHDALSAETLDAMIQEFVLREGTDYGHEEYSLEEKIVEVRKQLNAGKASIVFDEASESFDLIRKG